MSTIGQMTEHLLETPKGWFDGMALDFIAKKSANVTFTLHEGRVVHVATAGENPQDCTFETGVAGTQMPIFVHRRSDGFDVSNPGRTASGGFVHEAIAPAGHMAGLVATGGYELESSEYNSARTYAPNNLLTALVNNTTSTIGGVLDNTDGSNPLTVPWAGGGTTKAICGVVSRGVFASAHGTNVLAFWPVFLPGTT